MEKKVTHYCLLRKIYNIIILIIKPLYIIRDVRVYLTALIALYYVYKMIYSVKCPLL